MGVALPLGRAGGDADAAGDEGDGHAPDDPGVMVGAQAALPGEGEGEGSMRRTFSIGASSGVNSVTRSNGGPTVTPWLLSTA